MLFFFFGLNSCSHNVLDLFLQAGVCQNKNDFCFLLNPEIQYTENNV